MDFLCNIVYNILCKTLKRSIKEYQIKYFIMKKLHYLSFALFSVMTMFVAFAAQATSHVPGSGIGGVGNDTFGSKGNFNTTSITTLVSSLLGWFSWVVAVVAVAIGLYSAFLFITAGGDDTKLKTAKDMLIYTIIGIVVAILSFSIVSIAKSVSGI